MIKIVFSGIGPVIGERMQAPDPALQALKDPRMFITDNAPNGQVTFKIVTMTGTPTHFTTGIGVAAIDVNDEAIVGSYRQSVTGLVLVKPPLNPGMRAN